MSATVEEKLFLHTIICDCYYGFSRQKRPRQERIRSVAHQMFNFVSHKDSRHCDGGDDSCTSDKYPGNETIAVKLMVVGENNDLHPLYERFCQLLHSSSFFQNELHFYMVYIEEDDDDDERGRSTKIENKEVSIVFLPGKTIHQCVIRHKRYVNILKSEKEEISKKIDGEDDLLHIEFQNLQIQHGNDGNPVEKMSPKAMPANKEEKNNVVAYLSPDAKSALDATQPPPNIVVVGMLVDRRVVKGRSKSRADSLELSSFSLPMSLLHSVVLGLSDDEPLNIDTVLDIMDMWWTNSHRRQKYDNENESKNFNKKAFLDAALCAMKMHEARHPRRVLHQPVLS